MHSTRKISKTTQTISFSEGDGVCSSEVYASDVIVTTNAGNHNHGSSKFKLKSLVDYNWEPKFYPGQLLAVHLSGKYLAYSIKAPNPNNPGTWNGMVRVVYTPEPGIDKRTLIKGMKGEVQDLDFAHIQNQVVLACIDEMGNFYVHEIEDIDTGLRCTSIVEVREDTGVGGSAHRVVWCPYIPDDDDDDDDVARLLLTTHANIARMWNIREVSAACASGGVAGADALLAGGAGRAAGAHAAALTAAAFSPDGTALATASVDGYVMFAQVYMNNDSSPRCLHKWQPHDGKPLSCLFFLDNHKNYNADEQFWKFAVTGADNNTSIKIWTCKTWDCLQTITFSPSIDTSGMKAMLDSSANYLLLSDFTARSLYVLNMTRDNEDTVAYCKSISEFLLPYPVLSFCIADAEEQQVKSSSSCDDPYRSNGSAADAGLASPDEFDLHNDECSQEEEKGSSGRRVRMRLYIVQPKGLQEGTLLYTPPALHALIPSDGDVLPLHDLEDLTLQNNAEEVSNTSMPSNILQQQTQQLKNLLMRTQTQPGSLIVPRAESPAAVPPLNLMTPDAFSSPGKRDDDDPPLSATPEMSSKARVGGAGATAAATATAAADKRRVSAGGGVTEEVLLVGGNADGKLASGGSSPSLEVQQIMAQSDQPFYQEIEMVEEEAAEAVAVVGAANSLYGSAEPPAALPLNSNETSWPQISLAQITEANHRKASSDKSSTHSLSAPLPASLPPPLTPIAAPPPLVAPVNPPLPNVLNPAIVTQERSVNEYIPKGRLDALEEKLDTLSDLIAGQARELRALRSEVHEARPPRELLDELLREHVQRTAVQLDAALATGWERVVRLGETAARAAGAAAGGGAARALEPLAAALHHELATKLTATDHLLRDNIDKLVTSKTVMDKLSTCVAASLAEMVRGSFREALAGCVLPAMEKAQAQMFKQINQAFQNGTKEFTAHTEEAARAAAGRGGAAAAAELRTALQQHADALAAAQRATQPHHVAAQLKEVAHSVLEKEVAWWREQTRSAVQMSRAHSPATSVHTPSVLDRQVQANQVASLMMSGDMNGAFQLALSASDLSLVVGACRAADPTRVFGPPCRLKQHVLLSLVQQLAADMSHDTALKHRYLEDAIMNLDTTNVVTREHLPGVIRELQKQIMVFLNSNPGYSLTKQFKMLLMATESLVKAV